jgi:hypothetical protein
MPKQCFCGCGRTVRFSKGRASKFGGDVAKRVDELSATKDQVIDTHVPMLLELIKGGEKLIGDWKHVAHGDRLITGTDRLSTESYLDTSNKMLAFSRLDAEAQREFDERKAAGADPREIKRLLDL